MLSLTAISEELEQLKSQIKVVEVISKICLSVLDCAFMSKMRRNLKLHAAYNFQIARASYGTILKSTW